MTLNLVFFYFSENKCSFLTICECIVETVKWQRNDRYEGWKDFSEDINNRLEKAYQKNPHGNFSYSKGGKRCSYV